MNIYPDIYFTPPPYHVQCVEIIDGAGEGNSNGDIYIVWEDISCMCYWGRGGDGNGNGDTHTDSLSLSDWCVCVSVSLYVVLFWWVKWMKIPHTHTHTHTRSRTHIHTQIINLSACQDLTSHRRLEYFKFNF